MKINHNQLKTYNYRDFVVRLYWEQHTKWWFFQYYYSSFSPPENLEWSQPLDFEQQATEVAELCIDEILLSYA